MFKSEQDKDDFTEILVKTLVANIEGHAELLLFEVKNGFDSDAADRRLGAIKDNLSKLYRVLEVEE